MMKQLRVLSVMAHQDDFEFEAAGLFLRLRQHYGSNVALKIVTTSCGGSGHHEMSFEETVRRREAEAQASAAIVGAEYENLRQLDGTHIPAQVFCDRNMLGGLWNCIRDYAPDYVIAPPVVTNPLAGIHIDHQHTAEALRYIAYQLGVPNAYPTMNAPRQQRFRVPVFLVCLDAYSQENIWDFSVNVDSVKEEKIQMLRCHASQIEEWLPFVDSLNDPDGAIYQRGPNGENIRWSEERWRAATEQRFHQRNRLCGFDDSIAREYFAITKWGTSSNNAGLTVKESLALDFPFSDWRQ
ncbi:MAG: PIG-L family deacetylase [Oligosphaeraceae bacterium]|nr:PIG-L family deacetylase [Oligosphaeraceae bacterium]